MILLLLFFNLTFAVAPIPYQYFPIGGAVVGQNYACATDSYGTNIANCPWIALASLAAQDSQNNKTTFTFKSNWWWPSTPVCTTTQFAITSTTSVATVVGNQTVYQAPPCQGVGGCGCEDYNGDGCMDYCSCSGGPEGDDWCCYKGGVDVRDYVPTTGAFTLTCHN